MRVKYSLTLNWHKGWMRGQPLYKYIDLESAGFLERGSIKIGTLRGYASLESSRADRNEGTYTAMHPGTLTQGDDNFEQKAFALGIGIGPGCVGTQIKDCIGQTVGRNYNCFCTSDRPGLPAADANKPEACFRINNTTKFVAEVRRTCPQFLGARIHPVQYGSRIFDIRAGLPSRGPDPYLKPLQFKDEHEVRWLWDLAPGHPVEEVYTPESEALAELMIRIA